MLRDNEVHTINRLTALWALSESGLGGMMHAMKLPFTGFFLGGFAVVIIALIGHFSSRPGKKILQSTFLVLLVKAAVSPHAPFPAYIAVGFQGLAGACCYTCIRHFRAASVLFGAVALLESAVQKFLVTTLIFGRSVWEALDLFFQGILKDLHLPGHFSFSFWLISIYTGIYFTWGIVLGWWASQLPGTIGRRADGIIRAYHNLKVTKPVASENPGKRKSKWLFPLLVLLFITVVLLTGDAANGNYRALYAIIRTVAVLLFIAYVIGPLIRWGMNRLLAKRANKDAARRLIEQLPGLRSKVRPAYTLAAASHRGLKKYREFVLNLIVLSLYADTDSNNNLVVDGQ